MENLIIPQISAVGACIIAVCVLVSAIKQVVPKRLIVWLPLIFSLPLGVIVALSETGWTLELIQSAIIRIFSICAGSMASYDLVSKTLKGWKKNVESSEEEDDAEQTNKE